MFLGFIVDGSVSHGHHNDESKPKVHVQRFIPDPKTLEDGAAHGFKLRLFL